MRLPLIALLVVLGTGVWAQQAPPPAATPQGPARGRGPQAPPPSFSHIKVYDFATNNVREVFSGDGYLDSPEFSADGKFIRFSSLPNSKLLQVPVAGGAAESVGPEGFGWGHDRAHSRDGQREAAGNFNTTNPIAFLGPHYTDLKEIGGPFYVQSMSPDGKWIAFRVAKPGGDARDVTVRIFPAPAAKAVPGPSREILTAVGGQGMMHRNSWSPDSTKIAFASYEPR
jgi:Tol biopolymer transport system component